MTKLISKESVQEYVQAGLWTADDVKRAVRKGYLTEAEAKEILGEE